MTSDDMDEFLEQGETVEQPARSYLPKNIPFSSNAYKKARAIGPLIQRLAKRDYEWSGFMLAEKDNGYMVRDVILEDRQIVGPGSVLLTGENIAKVSYQIEQENKRAGRNFYPIGWIHGHGSASSLGPSGVDDKGFDTFLNSNGMNTDARFFSELNLLGKEATPVYESGLLSLIGKEMEAGMAEFRLGDEEKIQALLKKYKIDFKPGRAVETATGLLASLFNDGVSTKYFQPRIIGFSYFVITSNKPDVASYGEIRYTEEKHFTKKKSEGKVETVGIGIMKTKDDVDFDLSKLEKEIRKSVRVFVPKKPTLFGYGGLTQTGVVPCGAINNANQWFEDYRGQRKNVYLSEQTMEMIYNTIARMEKSGADLTQFRAAMDMAKALDGVWKEDERQAILFAFLQDSLAKKGKKNKKKFKIDEKEISVPITGSDSQTKLQVDSDATDYSGQMGDF